MADLTKKSQWARGPITTSGDDPPPASKRPARGSSYAFVAVRGEEEGGSTPAVTRPTATATVESASPARPVAATPAADDAPQIEIGGEELLFDDLTEEEALLDGPPQMLAPPAAAGPASTPKPRLDVPPTSTRTSGLYGSVTPYVRPSRSFPKVDAPISGGAAASIPNPRASSPDLGAPFTGPAARISSPDLGAPQSTPAPRISSPDLGAPQSTPAPRISSPDLSTRSSYPDSGPRSFPPSFGSRSSYPELNSRSSSPDLGARASSPDLGMSPPVSTRTPPIAPPPSNPGASSPFHQRHDTPPPMSIGRPQRGSMDGIPAAPTSSPGGVSTAGPLGKTRTVLVISDDQTTIGAVSRVLGRTDVEVKAVSALAEVARALATSQRPVVLTLIDPLFAAKAGASLVTELKSKLPGQRIILVAPLSTQTLGAMLPTWGADGFLVTNRGLLHISAALGGWLGNIDQGPTSGQRTTLSDAPLSQRFNRG